MFKKFKDKLAEEVKSSPQRIQQFAQAAQAAVTSASSSISDITNNDLFSIGDNDASSKNQIANSQQNKLQEVSLAQQGNTGTAVDTMDYHMNREMTPENQRQRRLSNSSLASDISFRLPSYESPSMYHLQSDMEVSASEAEDRGLSGVTVNLDRVTKEQMYAAYRHTRDRCTKYKTQYADLARHYKILERENAKAKNVLVETQDKALRRISELREQCSLEQIAKAHLERALRIEIDEKNIKIDTLNTKLRFLQTNNTNDNINLVRDSRKTFSDGDVNDTPLITLAPDDVALEKESNEESLSSEITILNNKLEKMEQLLNKYKDSLKMTKEKNSQLTTELQIISSELESKTKENDQLKTTNELLLEAKKKIQELNENLEELQNINNSNEFLKSKEISILELSLKNSEEEVEQLHKKIEVLSKREEEYAISLAENKLSIHKELEGKENQIKSLTKSLTNSQNEIQSLNIILNDYKNSITQLEEKNTKLLNDLNEFNTATTTVDEVKKESEMFSKKCLHLESMINKSQEEYKCLELQMKQENAEKLAMVDRNVYLEKRITQLLEENSKKSSQISYLENELQSVTNNINMLRNKEPQECEEIKKNTSEVNDWKLKCNKLESEIQDERIELVKLQSEIEKLLTNHELVQNHNENLNTTVNELKSQINALKTKVEEAKQIKISCKDLKNKIVSLHNIINLTLGESKSFKQFVNASVNTFKETIIQLNNTAKEDIAKIVRISEDLKESNKILENEFQILSCQYKSVKNELVEVQSENEALKLKIKQINSENILHLEEIQNTNKQQQGEMNTLIEDFKKLNVEKLLLSQRNDSLVKENEELKMNINSITVGKEILQEDFNKISDMYKETINGFEVLSKERDELLELKEATEKKLSYINELEKRHDLLNDENNSLKNLSDTISKNVTDMELELIEVKKSHAQIVSEKDNLITIIDNYEKRLAESKQLDNQKFEAKSVDSNVIDELQENKKTMKALEEEIKLIKELNMTLSTQNKHNQLTIKQTDEILKQNVEDFGKIKEENKRLLSDIEGLQTHLTKVSKENSQLNDKLRELIASTENISEKSYNSNDLESLKNEIQIGEEKMDSLIRENSILAEENLELKDQIKSQSFNHSNTADRECTSDRHNIKEKYDGLLETKNNLQKKLTDLELMNQSINGNMQQVQANNDKLKLSNEKLGLRLDEALVSLRHLHSLQENTELEYLKNILYEYLTGSGMHSITLAKVLSAVVKFDDRQTELVLQKERERQGILRQLGII